MKQTITRYFCDRCGAEFKPYGTPDEMTTNYGVVCYASGTLYHPSAEAMEERFIQRGGKGTLCPDCYKGLVNYLNKKEI